MKVSGDLHNFARAVQHQTDLNGSEYFQKPRTLFWERLFFGVDSPFKTLFPKNVQPLIFGLAVEYEGPGYVGRVKRVPARILRAASQNDFFQFGVLLGYSYLFGIQDLHHENVVATEMGLQVIDAEVVLTKFTLPHESLLLPFKNTPFEKSALIHLSDSLELEPSLVSSVIDGFRTLLVASLGQVSKMAAIIEAEIGQQKVPIRVLLRDTHLYREWNNEPPIANFLLEERIQLERGDVPYFFKFLGQDNLFYYISRELECAEVKLPEPFSTGVRSIGVLPNELLNQERVEKFLLPSGTLFLLRKLLPASWTGDLSVHELKIAISKESITVIDHRETVTAVRARAPKA